MSQAPEPHMLVLVACNHEQAVDNSSIYIYIYIYISTGMQCKAVLWSSENVIILVILEIQK